MSILLSSEKSRKRLVVLGLDGLPLSLAQKIGHILPNIGRIASEATTVKAEIPELSPVNWTSFFTGKGPEDHGVFGFSTMNTQTYELSITDSRQIQCPTLFDTLGKHDFISRIINLPNMYPAQPIRGMLVAGFVAHSLPDAVYPPFLADKLHDYEYKLEADTNRGATDLEYLLRELRQTLHSRLKALDLMWPDLAWDLFVHVFTETDRLFHFFMDAVLSESHPLHVKCMQFLAEWDHALGLFLKKYDSLPAPKRLLVLADHGFTELKTEVCVNTWLAQNGYLTYQGTPQDEWDATVIGDESKAFALDPGRIYIHQKNRFARGQVMPSEKKDLIRVIRKGLLDLTLNGEKVMADVHMGPELYPGTQSAEVPDLICQAYPGFDLKAKFDRTNLFGFHGRTGTHTVEGAIFYDSQGSKPARMRDTGQTILEYFNIADS